MKLVNPALLAHYKKSDRIMLGLHIALFVFSLAIAGMHNTWLEAIMVGGGTLVTVFVIYHLASGKLASRLAMGIGLMVMTALNIQQGHGWLEFHFGLFVFIAMLLYYRDWIPVAAAAVTISLHHLIFYYLQTQGQPVFMMPNAEAGWLVVLLHVFYVVVEASVIIWMSLDFKKSFVNNTQLVNTTNRIVGAELIDLSVRTPGGSEMLERFDYYTSSVESLVRQVSDNTDALHQSSGELVEATDVLKKESAQQLKQADVIARSVGSMKTSARDVSDHAGNAADAADKANAMAGQCKASGLDSENSIAELDKQITHAYDTINSLDSETSKIGSLLDVIRGIAEQTNLLALNAAIEAARAGEQGRGFAVVADEVRSLAQRTQESTRQIDDMIERLQKESRSAVNAMDNSKSLVDRNVEITQKNMELVSNISEEINRINELNQVIASSSQNQREMTENISDSLGSIVESSSAMNDRVLHTNEITDQLEVFASKLDAIRKQFKVS